MAMEKLSRPFLTGGGPGPLPASLCWFPIAQTPRTGVPPVRSLVTPPQESAGLWPEIPGSLRPPPPTLINPHYGFFLTMASSRDLCPIWGGQGEGGVTEV